MKAQRELANNMNELHELTRPLPIPPSSPPPSLLSPFAKAMGGVALGMILLLLWIILFWGVLQRSPPAKDKEPPKSLSSPNLAPTISPPRPADNAPNSQERFTFPNTTASQDKVESDPPQIEIQHGVKIIRGGPPPPH